MLVSAAKKLPAVSNDSWKCSLNRRMAHSLPARSVEALMAAALLYINAASTSRETQVAAVTVRVAIFTCEEQTELRGGGQHDAYENNGSSRCHRITNTLFSFATGKRLCVQTQEMQLEEA